MKHLRLAAYILIFSFLSLPASAQRRGTVSFESIYRPVYGYVVDTSTNMPMKDVAVYAFDSMEDALKGKDALEQSRNPLKIRLKGDAVETLTDATGRYMLPARNTGVLMFHIRSKGVVVVEEIAGRSSVSIGKKDEEKEYVRHYDLSGFKGYTPKKWSLQDPEGIDLDFDFKCYFHLLGKDAADSRIKVERRLVDLDSGELLCSEVPLVRDGKGYHKNAKRQIARGMLHDTLYAVAERFPRLSDTTSSVRVRDAFNTGPWRLNCFRLGYFVLQEKGGQTRPLDTLYMMTNRVSRPLKYLRYEFDPYCFVQERDAGQPGKALPVKRRLVLREEYRGGGVPEILKDSSYLLDELHLKAVVSPARSYAENIARADSMVNGVMAELRKGFGDKLNENVRITKISEVSKDSLWRDRVEYRYILRTDRVFSRNEYLDRFAGAEDSVSLEGLCMRALEESDILEGQPWDYAANLLASLYIARGHADTSLLLPFIDTAYAGCDIRYVDPVLDRPAVRNRNEIVADQVLMLMMSGRYADALKLSEMLPKEYSFLREAANCRAGGRPSGPEAVKAVRESFLRNDVLMDMYEEVTDAGTLDKIRRMEGDDAMALYLTARYYSIMNENKTARMKDTFPEDIGCSVYDEVKRCLKECFGMEPSFRSMAVVDSGINEDALKDVLGVLVL